MIKSIIVTNYLGDSIELNLRRPERSGLALLGVTGLGPDKATINLSEYSRSDGGKMNSARRPSRNIVLAIKYLWKNTIEETRYLSYRYFPLKKEVTLLIETDTRKVEIKGYVETNEPNIFSSASTTQISIICPDPNFYSVGADSEISTRLSGSKPLFEFPFDSVIEYEQYRELSIYFNNILTDGFLEATDGTQTALTSSNLYLEGTTPTIEFGIVDNINGQSIEYKGDAEVGVVISIVATGKFTNLVIHNLTTGESMKIDNTKLEKIIGSEIMPGDRIDINTSVDHKSATLVRSISRLNILNCITRDSDWIKLSSGINRFAYTTDYGTENLRITIKNKVAYLGV